MISPLVENTLELKWQAYRRVDETMASKFHTPLLPRAARKIARGLTSLEAIE